MRSWCGIVALVFTACGAPPEPADPVDALARYLGDVDARGEADLQIERWRASGCRVTARIDAARYVAYQLDCGDIERVRVVTSRATVLAFDAGGAAPQERHSVRLVPLSDPPPHELAIAAREASSSRTCYALYSIVESGAAVALELDAPAVPSACIERIEDLDDDGILDAFIVERLALADDSVLEVLRPLSPTPEGKLGLVRDARAERLLRVLGEQQRALIVDAGAAGRALDALRFALVAARLELLRSGVDAARGTFRQAAADLTLDARGVELARAFEQRIDEWASSAGAQ